MYPSIFIYMVFFRVSFKLRHTCWRWVHHLSMIRWSTLNVTLFGVLFTSHPHTCQLPRFILKNKLNIHRPAVFCGLCNGYHLFFNPSWLRNTNLWVTMIGLVIQESARHVPKSQSGSRRWTGFSIKRKVTDDFWQLLTLMLKPKSPCSLRARDSGTRALCCPSLVWLLMCQGSLAG